MLEVKHDQVVGDLPLSHSLHQPDHACKGDLAATKPADHSYHNSCKESTEGGIESIPAEADSVQALKDFTIAYWTRRGSELHKESGRLWIESNDQTKRWRKEYELAARIVGGYASSLAGIPEVAQARRERIKQNISDLYAGK